MNFFHCSSHYRNGKNIGVITEDKLTKLTYTYQQKKDILAAAEKENKLYNKAEGKKQLDLTMRLRVNGFQRLFFEERFEASARSMTPIEIAVNQAVAAGQPTGTAIYFAVDYDATASDLNNILIP